MTNLAERKKEFEELLDTSKYQVFLYSCKANIPFSFAEHPWFVVNAKGTISRWEIRHQKTHTGKRWGHLYKDTYLPYQGIEVVFYMRFHWDARFLGYVDGDEGSVAHDLAEVILRSPEDYPYVDNYFLLGPNSNSYAQWILDRFPDLDLSLPWNAIGKHYKFDKKL